MNTRDTVAAIDARLAELEIEEREADVSFAKGRHLGPIIRS